VRNAPDKPTSVWSILARELVEPSKQQRKQMTVERSTDASLTSPKKPTSWKAIDWLRVRQEVRGLQMRIAKATQAGKHRKAQALQWLRTGALKRPV